MHFNSNRLIFVIKLLGGEMADIPRGLRGGEPEIKNREPGTAGSLAL